MLYAVPLVLLLKDWRPSGSQATRGERFANQYAHRAFDQRVVPPAGAYFTLPAIAGWVVRDWMPAILKEQFGIGQGTAGVAATLVLAKSPRSSAPWPAGGSPIIG